VGRLEEARALFSGHRRRGILPDAGPVIVAARFFLGVAYCRAGRLDEAKREFSLNARAESRRGEPLARFYVLQGFGCYRYFTGRLQKAARHARWALEHAFVAESDPLGWMSSAVDIAAVVFASSPRLNFASRPSKSRKAQIQPPRGSPRPPKARNPR
jgi:hypothetical protein